MMIERRRTSCRLYQTNYSWPNNEHEECLARFYGGLHSLLGQRLSSASSWAATKRLGDAKTLQDAHRAYVESDGSFQALVVSLLSSDSFIYWAKAEVEKSATK